MKFPLQKAEEHMAALWWDRKSTAHRDPGEQLRAGLSLWFKLGICLKAPKCYLHPECACTAAWCPYWRGGKERRHGDSLQKWAPFRKVALKAIFTFICMHVPPKYEPLAVDLRIGWIKATSPVSHLYAPPLVFRQLGVRAIPSGVGMKSGLSFRHAAFSHASVLVLARLVVRGWQQSYGRFAF